MTKLLHVVAILSLGILIACSGSQTAPGSTGQGDDTSTNDTSDQSVSNEAEDCEGYSVGDSCMNADNFAQCQSMAAQCPGQVQAMESCPLQFACPQ